jgi:hypothetical protein
MKRSNFSIILLLALSMQVMTTTEIDFKLGAMSINDHRFIYPAEGQYNVPIGSSLSAYNGAVTVEPRLNFLRTHDTNCRYPTRGYFKNHVEVFWFCANTDKTKPGQLRVANPEYPGKRETLPFKEMPSKDDFVLIVPLSETKQAIVVAKTATPGTYDIYSKDAKLKQLVTGDATFHKHAKLRAFIAPKLAKKEYDVYFYIEDEVGATNIFQYQVDKQTFTKHELKKIDKDGPLGELKRLMHATVSETYISFTGVYGDKTDQLKFTFIKYDEKTTATTQIQKSSFSYREIPQEGGKTEASPTAKAWAFKTDDQKADVFVYNKTPKATGVHPYVQFGSVAKSKADSVNDHLNTYKFDKATDPHKKYELHHVSLNKEYIRFAWRDPTSGDIKTVWETRWGQKGHRITRTIAELEPGFKEIQFVFPAFIVAIKEHFEYNYHHFNYVFNPLKMEKSKREPGTDHNFAIEVASPHLETYEVFKLNIKYQIVDTKKLKTYSEDDKNKATISAITGTLIEFQIPEINFRGNNVNYSAELGGNGIMISNNEFSVTPEKATDKIELLDDLFGQSIQGKFYKIHKCDMTITKDIKVTCKEAAKTVEYKHGDLKQLAQVNTLHGIYTVFEGKNTAKPAEVPIGKYIKATHDKDESLTIDHMDFSKDLGGKPDFLSMGIGKKKVTIFAVRVDTQNKKTLVSKREIDDLEGKSSESFDISQFIPSFKGKNCVPKEISKSDFYDDDNNLINRAFVTFECDGIKTIVDWRNKFEEGKPNIREILNYPGVSDVKTCVTKGGILEMNVKTKTL